MGSRLQPLCARHHLLLGCGEPSWICMDQRIPEVTHGGTVWLSIFSVGGFDGRFDATDWQYRLVIEQSMGLEDSQVWYLWNSTFRYRHQCYFSSCNAFGRGISFRPRSHPSFPGRANSSKCRHWSGSPCAKETRPNGSISPIGQSKAPGRETGICEMNKRVYVATYGCQMDEQGSGPKDRQFLKRCQLLLTERREPSS